MADKKIKFVIEGQDKSQNALNSAVGKFRSFDKELMGPLQNIQKQMSMLGNTAIVAIGAKAVGAVIDFGKACVSEFAKVERANTTLSFALKQGGIDANNINKLIGDLASVSNATDDDLTQLASTLGQLGRNEPEIKNMMTASVNLANTLNIDVFSAYEKLNATLTGTGGKLEKIIPEIGNLSTEQLKAGGAIDLVNNKLQKYTDLMGDTTSQKLKNINEGIGNLKENLGARFAEGLSPGLTALDTYISKLNEIISKTTKGKSDSVKSADALALFSDKNYDAGNLIKSISNKSLDEQKQILSDLEGWIKLYDKSGYYETELTKIKERLSVLQPLKVGEIKPNQVATYNSGVSEAKDKSGYNPANDPSLYTQSSMAGVGGASDLGKSTGAGWLPPAEDIEKLSGMKKFAEEFKTSWNDSLQSVANNFQSWGSFAFDSIATAAQGLKSGLVGVGEALAQGGNGWKALGQAALASLGQILSALGDQLAALAVVELVKGNFVGAGLAAAGSAAAYIAGGFVGAKGSSSSSADSSSSSSSSTQTYSAGGGYSGPSTLIVNNYLNGVFYSQADLDRHLVDITLTAIGERNLGIASAS